MSINLADIPTAVADYLKEKVTVTVTEVEPDFDSDLNRDEEGTYTVTVTNGNGADDPLGVRLIDVKYHLKVEPTGIVELKVPASTFLASRSTSDQNAPVLPDNTFVNEMFIFPASAIDQATLEVGETDSLTLEVKGVGAGMTKLTCHVHALVHPDDLFQVQNSDNGEQVVRVR